MFELSLDICSVESIIKLFLVEREFKKESDSKSSEFSLVDKLCELIWVFSSVSYVF